jgi:hypothetical protein
MKTFTFYDDSWYDQPGCSCCEGTYMECYTSDDTDCNLGSAHDYESCYYHAILTELGVDNVTEEHREGLCCMNLKELKEIAKDLNIKVEIVS